MKVLILSSQAYSLCHFRLDMMVDFIKAGHEVHAAAPDDDMPSQSTLKENGIMYHSFRLERNGQNPFKDIVGFFSIRSMLKEVHPDIVFAYQAKTVIYGCIAARSLGISRSYALISGLGSVLRKNGGGFSRKIIKYILGLQYFVALKFPQKVFFHNHDDAFIFTAKHLVNLKKVRLLNGSGVNLDQFKLTPMPLEKRFLFIGRLIGDKGIIEYLKAAEMVKMSYPDVQFDIIGYYDSNPTAVKPYELERYFHHGIANFLGKQDDVYPFIARCFCLVLPSYHEGTPKTVLEAMSVGRPIITTDAPGCRDTVTDGINGYIVPICDVEMLTQRMIDIINSKDDIDSMAKNSRSIAVSKYDVHLVNQELIKEMEL